MRNIWRKILISSPHININMWRPSKNKLLTQLNKIDEIFVTGIIIGSYPITIAYLFFFY